MLLTIGVAGQEPQPSSKLPHATVDTALSGSVVPVAVELGEVADNTFSTTHDDPQPNESLTSSDESPRTGTSSSNQSRGPPEGQVLLRHLDVGQADATLIQSPDGTILIDAGHWQRNDIVPHLQRIGIETIDLIILTHPHADHIGQVPQILEAFPVTEVWMSGWEHTSQTFERVLDAVLASEAGYHEPRAGESVEFGDLRVEVVHPVDPLRDIHDNLAVRIVFGNFAALYTGDAEVSHEREMLEGEHELRSQVLQLGHHGSRTSSSRRFLDGVAPEVAIYSAGTGNTYGHPHREVVNRVTGLGITLYGTDIHGTILVTSDGEDYQVAVERRPAENRLREEQQTATSDHGQQSQTDDCVNINEASEEDLQQIIHIGPARSSEIVQLRPFESVDQLTRVRGIGPARLRDIKDQGIACVR
ncbi:MBL fold metallo-hydrolase [Phycisphaerales bacterium AB-hyl4]|uniref:MBL fold metallo-hydrolase n=1 Tax=Natronomicrosphaera hydrolytica TaxID=3242702 RepID=A0ABV4U9G9_9BACT